MLSRLAAHAWPLPDYGWAGAGRAWQPHVERFGLRHLSAATSRSFECSFSYGRSLQQTSTGGSGGGPTSRRCQQRQRSTLHPASSPGWEPVLDAGIQGLAVQQLLELADSKDLTPQQAVSLMRALDAAVVRGDGRGRSALRDHPALPRLFQVLQQGCGELQIRDIVALLKKFVLLGMRPPRALLSAASEELCHRLPAAAPAEACLATWALTKLGHPGVHALLGAISAQVKQQQEQQRQIQRQQQQQQQQPAQPDGQRQQQDLTEAAAAPPPWLAQLPPTTLVNLLWACAKAGFRSKPLMEGITSALMSSAAAPQLAHPRSSGRARGRGSLAPLASLDAQSLSMLFYSLGLLQWAPEPQFLRRALKLVEEQLPAFSPQGLSNTAWALSKLGPQPGAGRVMAALAEEAAARLPYFTNQELGMLLMAVAGFRSGAAGVLLEAAGEELAGRVAALSERDLSSMLSALASAGQRPSDRVLSAVARRIEQLLPNGMVPASIAWVLWSYARFAHRPPRSLMRKAEAALRGPQLPALYAADPSDVARLCWALSELQYYSGALLADLAAVARSMWERLPPQSMAMVLHSYAQLQFTPHELLDAAAEHLAAHLPEYEPQAVAMVMWSFGKLGVHPGRGLPAGGLCTPDGTPLMAAVAAYGTQHAHTPQQRQPSERPGPRRQAPEVGAFTLQGISMLLWSFATLEHHPGSALLQAASARFQEALQRQQAAVAAAAAAAQAGGGVVLGEEAEQAQQQGQSMQLQPAQGRGRGRGAACLRSTSQLAWSFAKFGHADEPFFAALAAGALPPVQAGENTPQSLTLLAYSAAKLRVPSAGPLLRQMLPLVEIHIRAFSAEDVCQLLWALAHVGGLQAAVPLPLLDAAVARLAAVLNISLDATSQGGSSSSSGASSSIGSTGALDARLLCMAVHALACLQYRCPPALLDASVRQVAAAADVSVSLLAKLLWGCAHVGHEPSAKELDVITSDLYHRLSHSRGNRTVLNVPDLVLLLWALAVLQQYHTPLYRNVAFRATRLPDGVPEPPRLRRMLREATVLHSCEHRADPVAAEAASAILPAWLASQQAQQALQQSEAADGRAAPDTWASAGSGTGTGQPPLERRAEAEAACAALRAAGMYANLRQLSYGDYIVVLGHPTSGSSTGSTDDGSRKRGSRANIVAAVVPATVATGRAAANDPHHLLGSALVARRVLTARELEVSPGTGSEAELVARCAALVRQQQQQAAG